MTKITNARKLKWRRLRFKRRQFRIGIITLGIFATLMIGFNFWFVDHSESVLEEIVTSQSNGKLRLKVEKFKFNWIKNKIELRDALFYTTDSTAPTITQFTVSKIDIKARGFLPLLFKKQILIDSIHLYAPKVLITKIYHAGNEVKVPHATPADTTQKFSATRELGKISNSIREAISALQINRFVLDNGSFTLVDNTAKEQMPFVIDKINIKLDNLQVDEATHKKSRKRIAFTDDLAIQTSDQNIVFPGGRHFLSFKNFRFGLNDRIVQFDSCTIRGVPGDSSKSAFRIFFDKLQMTNINFDTLYATEVLQADSVFCTNADIALNIDRDTRKKNKKKIQNIDELVQQLLGDVMLNHVVVKNASININTIKGGKENNFSIANNDFQLQGLSIRQNYDRPVRLERLYMKLRDYETTLQNGRYTIAFDSVRFEDDAITLNDFNFREYGKVGLTKSLKMPRLEVRGMSWDDLLYENTFSAASARFYSPTIMITSAAKKTNRPKSIFESLGELGRVMELEELYINDGNITLNLPKRTSLLLHNANVSIYARELTDSKKIKNIQHAIKDLEVSKAVFNKKTLKATLNNLSLIENNNGIRASSLLLKDEGLYAKANNIRIGSIILDSISQAISLSALRWGNASISLNSNTKDKKDQKKTGSANNFLLTNIAGGPTGITIKSSDKIITAFLTSISVNRVYKPISGTPQINGLQVTGRDVLMTAPGQRLSVDRLAVSDNKNSVIYNVNFTKTDATDSIVLNIPEVSIIPNVTQIVAGNFYVQSIILTDPVIAGKLGKKDTTEQTNKKPPPQILLGTALLRRPKITLTLINKNGLPSYVSWNGLKENSFIRLTDFLSNANTPVSAHQADIYLTNFEYTNAKGKKVATNDNKLNLRFTDISVQKDDSNKVAWKTNASILSLDQLYFDSLGKNHAVLTLNKGDVKNITLNSNHMATAMDIIKNSKNLQLTGTDGTFTSATNKVMWYNLSFHNNFMMADSFNLAPLQTIEDYKIKKAFDQDYLTISSGTITGGPFNLVQYGTDSILSIASLQLNNIRLLTFKDKRQPEDKLKIKPLPVHQILKIPGKVNIDSVRLKDMYVEYWEINPKTDTLGIVPVNNLNVVLKNIKNHNIQEHDSLYILAAAKVLGELSTTLDVRESYSDSLGTFTMKLKTGPMALQKFTDVLLPLEAIKVLSGQMDSLQIEAVGNDDYSTGNMRMYYTGLRLRLMNKKDSQKQNFVNKLLSWVANAIVVRKNNNGKNSPAFFERWKDKSAINFLIKTTLSGIKSSIGLPGVKGKQRRYLRKLKRQQERIMNQNNK